MAKKPDYARYLDSENALFGFSSIAPGFWRSAEKLRDEAIQQTNGQSWPTHWTTHSIICLYHAALDCFINEEITLKAVLSGSQLSNAAYEIQGMTLNAKKLDAFFSHCGLAGKQTPEVRRRTLLLIGLRNRLSHHWPEMRDVRDYPVDVIDALTDAKIEKLNTSWTAQCSDVRLSTRPTSLGFHTERLRHSRRFPPPWYTQRPSCSAKVRQGGSRRISPSCRS
jgi:hypothetical protein